MNQLIRPLLIAFTLFPVPSCVTSSDSQFYETSQVIEKSKIKEPQWIRRTVGTIVNTDYDLSSVDYQENILNLPDGIRAAQKNALDAHFTLLVDYFFNSLTDLAISESIDMPQKTWLQGDLENALNPLHKEHSKIKDIYYEKLRDNSQSIPKEHYRVFVLATFPKAQEKSFFSSLQKILKKRAEIQLRQNCQKY